MRSLHVLGTSSMAPTKYRNQNGYFVEWNFHKAATEGLVFDPGEGCQRQLITFGISAAKITKVLISHFHGDHCLGLPGLIQAVVNATKDFDHTLEIYYPASGENFFNALRYSCAYKTRKLNIVPKPIAEEGVVFVNDHFSITARYLKHRMPTFGYRVQEHPKRTMNSQKLKAIGFKGHEIGELCATGKLIKDEKTYLIDEFSTMKSGASFAFVMDSVPCENALLLASRSDLLVCESTYLSEDEEEAKAHGHMTALQAARIAFKSKSKKLALTHFSQRYPRTKDFEIEAQRLFEHSIAVIDGDVIQY